MIIDYIVNILVNENPLQSIITHEFGARAKKQIELIFSNLEGRKTLINEMK